MKLSECTDEQIKQLVTELETSNRVFNEGTLLSQYVATLPPHIATFQAPIEIYKEAATRYAKLPTHLTL